MWSCAANKVSDGTAILDQHRAQRTQKKSNLHRKTDFDMACRIQTAGSGFIEHAELYEWKHSTGRSHSGRLQGSKHVHAVQCLPFLPCRESCVEKRSPRDHRKHSPAMNWPHITYFSDFAIVLLFKGQERKSLNIIFLQYAGRVCCLATVK